ASVLMLTGFFGISTVGIFYARNVLGNSNYFIHMTIIQTGTTLLVAPLLPALVRRLDKKGTFIFGAVLAMLGGVLLFFAPPDILLLALAAYAVLNFGLQAMNMVVWALEADTVEYGEWVTGVRTEGATYAIFSFTRKLG